MPIRVDLGHDQSPRVTARQLLEVGRDHPTGRAPRRPEVHEDRHGAVLDEAPERFVVDLRGGSRQIERALTAATLGARLEAIGADAVDGAARGAMENELVHPPNVFAIRAAGKWSAHPLSGGALASWLLVSLLSGCHHDAVEEGAEVYARTCENCHGEDGNAGVQVDGVAAPDLAAFVPAFSDEDLTTIIADGFGAMPPQDLGGREIEDVIAYLRATFGE